MFARLQVAKRLSECNANAEGRRRANSFPSYVSANSKRNASLRCAAFQRRIGSSQICKSMKALKELASDPSHMHRYKMSLVLSFAHYFPT